MQVNDTATGRRKTLAPRRLALLASVAGLGAAVLFTAPSINTSLHALTPSITSARAAEVAHIASFADVVAKVKPAVVSVRVKMNDDAANTTGMNNDDEDNSRSLPPEIQRFFRQFGMPNMPRQQHHFSMAQGSGFFISSDGYIVTNNHVVDHAKSVEVTTDDGKTLTAKVIGTDPKTDLALLKVDGRSDLPYVTLSDKQPRIGDWVIAVGNPFGLGGTVTAGIVSAQGRNIGSGPYDDYIQIDAPINKGNSGGPAFDVNGNVIGVNTAIYSPSGGSVGIGFDIPATTAQRVIAQLKDHGAVTRGWLGVQIQPVTSEIADSLGMKKAEGALVDSAQDGSPAAKAGVQAGDVITGVNGTAVKNARDLARTVATIKPDSTAKLDILRNGQSQTVTVTLGQMPNDQQANAGHEMQAPQHGVPHLGLSVAPAASVDGAGGKGVVVTAVDPSGPAADAGFKVGTVILDVGGKAVGNSGDVAKALQDAQAQGKHGVLMRVQVDGATRFVAVPLRAA
jgi:serine protease Do